MALLSPVDRTRAGARRVFSKVYRQPLNTIDDLGDQLGFYGRALAWTPRTLKRYKRETFRLLAEVTFGTGALAVIGGAGRGPSLPLFFPRPPGGPPGDAGPGPPGKAAVPRFL